MDWRKQILRRHTMAHSADLFALFSGYLKYLSPWQHLLIILIQLYHPCSC